MPIHVLPPEVASQIAAGEVIERPASVVKELLENALDAHATELTIHVEGAGKRLVEVADNGKGIPANEMPLAVERHATSKLTSAADLSHIGTLGFRGEALASIGSVARLTITSRPTDSLTGARLVVEGGKYIGLDTCGAPVGTSVRVEDLFFNVPARLKFLKQDMTERQAIDGLVTRYAIAYPAVRFLLTHDGKPVVQTSGSGAAREVLAALYGVETARQMISVLMDDESISISGFTSATSLTRSNRREMTFFINGRWVQDSSLSAALLQAYHTLLMVGRYPQAILSITMNPEDVDVNVHPAKAEVRFRNTDRVFSAIQRAVRRALLAFSPVPEVSAPSWQSPLPARVIDPGWEMSAQADRAPGEGLSVQTDQPQPQSQLLPGALPLLRLIGQVGAAYLVAEGPDGLYLIDQHAAHERVLFEKLTQQHDSQALASQALLEPLMVTMTAQAAAQLEPQLDALRHYGFDVEPFGSGAFRIRAIPMLLTGADPEQALRVVVENFEEDETPLQGQIEAKIIARVCKRVAVKAGQVLSPVEQQTLLRDLEACRSPRTCPHGRPTMIHLSVDLLERQFGRRGPR